MGKKLYVKDEKLSHINNKLIVLAEELFIFTLFVQMFRLSLPASVCYLGLESIVITLLHGQQHYVIISDSAGI